MPPQTHVDIYKPVNGYTTKLFKRERWPPGNPGCPWLFFCPSPRGLSHNADAHCSLWVSYGRGLLYGDKVQHSIFCKRSFLRNLGALQSDKGRDRNSYIVDVKKIHSPCSLQWAVALTIISEYGQCNIEKGMGGPKMGSHIATAMTLTTRVGKLAEFLWAMLFVQPPKQKSQICLYCR